MEQDTRDDFPAPREVYRGKDTATTISGLGDGVYYYRARLIDGNETDAARITVRVEHHGLGRAVFFLAMGLVVFLLTLVLILGGASRESRGAGSA